MKLNEDQEMEILILVIIFGAVSYGLAYAVLRDDLNDLRFRKVGASKNVLGSHICGKASGRGC